MDKWRGFSFYMFYNYISMAKRRKKTGDLSSIGIDSRYDSGLYPQDNDPPAQAI